MASPRFLLRSIRLRLNLLCAQYGFADVLASLNMASPNPCLAQYGFAAVFATLNTAASSKTAAPKFSLSLNMASSKFSLRSIRLHRCFGKAKYGFAASFAALIMA
jgi:hypothetical protein